MVEADTLTFLNWEHYINPEIVKKWEISRGHEIKFIYYDEEDKRDAILADAIDIGVDLTVVENTLLLDSTLSTIMLELDGKLHFPEYIENKSYQQCGGFGIPYFGGSLGIAYRKSVFQDKTPESWGDILKPKKELAHKIGMFKDYSDTIAIALKYLGYGASSDNAQELKDAYKLLIEQVPYVLTYDYVITYFEENQDTSNIVMALAYSGDQGVLNDLEKSNDWDYVVPKEGSVLWIDCLSVIKHSPRKDLALDFLNFINEPENAVLNVEEIELPVANIPAKEIINKKLPHLKSIFLNQNVLKNNEYYEIISHNQTQKRKKILRAISKAYESQ